MYSASANLANSQPIGFSGYSASPLSVTKHGVTKHGVTKHGVTKHGVTKHGVTKHGFKRCTAVSAQYSAHLSSLPFVDKGRSKAAGNLNNRNIQTSSPSDKRLLGDLKEYRASVVYDHAIIQLGNNDDPNDLVPAILARMDTRDGGILRDGGSLIVHSGNITTLFSAHTPPGGQVLKDAERPLYKDAVHVCLDQNEKGDSLYRKLLAAANKQQVSDISDGAVARLRENVASFIRQHPQMAEDENNALENDPLYELSMDQAVETYDHTPHRDDPEWHPQPAKPWLDPLLHLLTGALPVLCNWYRGEPLFGPLPESKVTALDVRDHSLSTEFHRFINDHQNLNSFNNVLEQRLDRMGKQPGLTEQDKALLLEGRELLLQLDEVLFSGTGLNKTGSQAVLEFANKFLTLVQQKPEPAGRHDPEDPGDYRYTEIKAADSLSPEGKVIVPDTERGEVGLYSRVKDRLSTMWNALPGDPLVLPGAEGAVTSDDGLSTEQISTSDPITSIDLLTSIEAVTSSESEKKRLPAIIEENDLILGTLNYIIDGTTEYQDNLLASCRAQFLRLDVILESSKAKHRIWQAYVQLVMNQKRMVEIHARDDLKSITTILESHGEEHDRDDIDSAQVSESTTKQDPVTDSRTVEDRREISLKDKIWVKSKFRKLGLLIPYHLNEVLSGALTGVDPDQLLLPPQLDAYRSLLVDVEATLYPALESRRNLQTNTLVLSKINAIADNISEYDNDLIGVMKTRLSATSGMENYTEKEIYQLLGQYTQLVINARNPVQTLPRDTLSLYLEVIQENWDWEREQPQSAGNDRTHSLYTGSRTIIALSDIKVWIREQNHGINLLIPYRMQEVLSGALSGYRTEQLIVSPELQAFHGQLTGADNLNFKQIMANAVESRCHALIEASNLNRASLDFLRHCGFFNEQVQNNPYILNAFNTAVSFIANVAFAVAQEAHKESIQKAQEAQEAMPDVLTTPHSEDDQSSYLQSLATEYKQFDLEAMFNRVSVYLRVIADTNLYSEEQLDSYLEQFESISLENKNRVEVLAPEELDNFKRILADDEYDNDNDDDDDDDDDLNHLTEHAWVVNEADGLQTLIPYNVEQVISGALNGYDPWLLTLPSSLEKHRFLLVADDYLAVMRTAVFQYTAERLRAPIAKPLYDMLYPHQYVSRFFDKIKKATLGENHAIGLQTSIAFRGHVPSGDTFEGVKASKLATRRLTPYQILMRQQTDFEYIWAALRNPTNEGYKESAEFKAFISRLRNSNVASSFNTMIGEARNDLYRSQLKAYISHIANKHPHSSTRSEHELAIAKRTSFRDTDGNPIDHFKTMSTHPFITATYTGRDANGQPDENTEITLFSYLTGENLRVTNLSSFADSIINKESDLYKWMLLNGGSAFNEYLEYYQSQCEIRFKPFQIEDMPIRWHTACTTSMTVRGRFICKKKERQVYQTQSINQSREDFIDRAFSRFSDTASKYLDCLHTSGSEAFLARLFNALRFITGMIGVVPIVGDGIDILGTYLLYEFEKAIEDDERKKLQLDKRQDKDLVIGLITTAVTVLPILETAKIGQRVLKRWTRGADLVSSVRLVTGASPSAGLIKMTDADYARNIKIRSHDLALACSGRRKKRSPGACAVPGIGSRLYQKQNLAFATQAPGKQPELYFRSADGDARLVLEPGAGSPMVSLRGRNQRVFSNNRQQLMDFIFEFFGTDKSIATFKKLRIKYQLRDISYKGAYVLEADFDNALRPRIHMSEGSIVSREALENIRENVVGPIYRNYRKIKHRAVKNEMPAVDAEKISANLHALKTHLDYIPPRLRTRIEAERLLFDFESDGFMRLIKKYDVSEDVNGFIRDARALLDSCDSVRIPGVSEELRNAVNKRNALKRQLSKLRQHVESYGGFAKLGPAVAQGTAERINALTIRIRAFDRETYLPLIKQYSDRLSSSRLIEDMPAYQNLQSSAQVFDDMLPDGFQINELQESITDYGRSIIKNRAVNSVLPVANRPLPALPDAGRLPAQGGPPVHETPGAAAPGAAGPGAAGPGASGPGARNPNAPDPDDINPYAQGGQADYDLPQARPDAADPGANSWQRNLQRGQEESMQYNAQFRGASGSSSADRGVLEGEPIHYDVKDNPPGRAWGEGIPNLLDNPLYGKDLPNLVENSLYGEDFPNLVENPLYGEDWPFFCSFCRQKRSPGSTGLCLYPFDRDDFFKKENFYFATRNPNGTPSFYFQSPWGTSGRLQQENFSGPDSGPVIRNLAQYTFADRATLSSFDQTFWSGNDTSLTKFLQLRNEQGLPYTPENGQFVLETEFNIDDGLTAKQSSLSGGQVVNNQQLNMFYHQADDIYTDIKLSSIKQEMPSNDARKITNSLETLFSGFVAHYSSVNSLTSEREGLSDQAINSFIRRLEKFALDKHGQVLINDSRALLDWCDSVQPPVGMSRPGQLKRVLDQINDRQNIIDDFASRALSEPSLTIQSEELKAELADFMLDQFYPLLQKAERQLSEFVESAPACQKFKSSYALFRKVLPEDIIPDHELIMKALAENRLWQSFVVGHVYPNEPEPFNGSIITGDAKSIKSGLQHMNDRLSELGQPMPYDLQRLNKKMAKLRLPNLLNKVLKKYQLSGYGEDLISQSQRLVEWAMAVELPQIPIELQESMQRNAFLQERIKTVNQKLRRKPTEQVSAELQKRLNDLKQEKRPLELQVLPCNIRLNRLIDLAPSFQQIKSSNEFIRSALPESLKVHAPIDETMKALAFKVLQKRV